MRKQAAINAGIERKERNRRMWDYHINHRNSSIAAIARMYKLSRQQAWLIINREAAKREVKVANSEASLLSSQDDKRGVVAVE